MLKHTYLILLLGMLHYSTVHAQCNANFAILDNTLCTGDPATFYNTSTGGATYLWNFGSGAVPLTSNAQNPPAVAYSTSGYKTITLTINGGGCSDNVTRNISVVDIPVGSFTSSAPQCIDQPVNFTFTGSGALSYEWDFGVGATPGSSTVQNPQGIMYSSSGSKTITLTVSNGYCSRTVTQAIPINATPTASFVSTAPKCTGMGVDFANTGTSAGATYSWNFGSGAAPATLTTQNPTAVVYSTSGIKTVTLTTTNSTTACAVTATETININQTPTVSFTSTAPVCVNTGVNFTNTGSTGSNWSYSWSFGQDAIPAAATAESPVGIKYSSGGTKTVTFTIADQYCTRSFSNTISINALPIANAGKDTTICANTSVQIGSAAIAGNTYTWFASNTLNNSKIANPVASPIAPVTQYIVTVVNASGCTNKDTVSVTMLGSLVADAGVDVEICKNDSIQIGAGLIKGQVYSWFPTAGLTNPVSSSPMVSPATTTVYTLTVTGSGCTSVKDKVTVTVYPLPAAYSEVDSITKGASVQLMAKGGIQYFWSPSIGLNNSGVYNPIASPDTTTKYIVTVTDLHGCVNKDTMTVRVIVPSFWVPTAFTPQGNGNNDVFYVRGDGINNFEFGVFNRIGELIFYTKDIHQGWDGKKQITSEEMPQGAYVYYVKGTLSNGTPVNSNGMVNLIR